MENIEEIRSIVSKIMDSGEVRSNISIEDFAGLSCLRHFHYNPERFDIEEADAKTLRAYFHNVGQDIYSEQLKDLFNV